MCRSESRSRSIDEEAFVCLPYVHLGDNVVTQHSRVSYTLQSLQSCPVPLLRKTLRRTLHSSRRIVPTVMITTTLMSVPVSWTNMIQKKPKDLRACFSFPSRLQKACLALSDRLSTRPSRKPSTSHFPHPSRDKYYCTRDRSMSEPRSSYAIIIISYLQVHAKGTTKFHLHHFCSTPIPIHLTHQFQEAGCGRGPLKPSEAMEKASNGEKRTAQVCWTSGTLAGAVTVLKLIQEQKKTQLSRKMFSHPSTSLMSTVRAVTRPFIAAATLDPPAAG